MAVTTTIFRKMSTSRDGGNGNDDDDMDDDDSNMSVKSIDDDDDDDSNNIKQEEMYLQTCFHPAMAKFKINNGRLEKMYYDDDDDNNSRKNTTPWASSTTTRNVKPLVKTLVSAQNQVVATQLHLTSNNPFVVHTTTSPWIHSTGHTASARVSIDSSSCLLADFKADLFLIKFVKTHEDNSEIMEVLSSSGDNSQRLSTFHAFYLRLTIPRNCPPGSLDIPLYIFTKTGGFTSESLTTKCLLSVSVAPVCLPNPTDFTFHLDLWQHYTSVARAHNVRLWSSEHFEIIESYIKLLASIGQKVLSVVVTEAPWSGQQCYLEKDYSYGSALFEHSILRIEHRHHHQCVSVDFTNLSRLLEIASRYGIDSEIEIFGLMSIWMDEANGFNAPVTISNNGSIDGWRIYSKNVDSGCYEYLSSLQSVSEFIKALYEFFKSRNLLQNVRICADEPSDVPRFQKQVEFITQIGPEFKFKVAINNFDFLKSSGALTPQVVDFVPLLPLACRDVVQTTELRHRITEKGGKMCWYVCCGPSYPNNFVKSPLVETRLVGWMTFFLKLDGFLRWNYCLWPSKPLDDLRWRTPMWPVGDMYFVLPGLDGKPVLTLRFEALRMAMQDYSLLKMAEEKKMSNPRLQSVFQEASSVIMQTQDLGSFASPDSFKREELYSLNPEDYDSAMNLIIGALSSSS